MKSFNAPLSIQRGHVTVDGKPVLFVSADYPYYRDNASNWENRLSLLKDMGVNVVTAYIPWRHHQTDPNTAPDFEGKTQPNRNVLEFLALIKKLGMSIIAKPGPFIHAETNYGSLPDWVCPLNNKDIEPLLDANGNFVYWSGARLNEAGTAPEAWPLPAPFSTLFLSLTREWLHAVGTQVIAPHQSPNGAIVALQAANEGIYSNGQHAPWAYDYSAPSLNLYREFLREQYQTLEKFNALNGSKFDDWAEIPAPVKWNQARGLREMRQFMDWGKYQAWYMNRVFHEWSAPLNSTLPIIVNQNPPLDEPYGLDAWLARTEPEIWHGIHYGFTNWVGDVSAKPSAFDRYLLAAKRYPAVNMEENWGFAELYDPAYVDASTSFYQTLVILNGGATGFNIYTGVGTGFKDTNLEVLPKAPYPDAAPITMDGEFTPKAETALWMTKFFDAHGGEFLSCRPQQVAAFAFYTPLARIAAWTTNDDSAPAHGKYLAAFQSQMRKLNLDYGVVNLETASVDELSAFPFLFVAGSPFMAADAQKKLAEYAKRGGQLTVIGELPELDENFSPCKTLFDARQLFANAESVSVEERLNGAVRPKSDSEADLWIRSHPNQDVHFVTALIPAHGNSNVNFTFQIGSTECSLQISAAKSGGAILRIENGRVTDYIVKGQNDFLNCSVAPYGSFNGQIFGDERFGDSVCVGGWIAHLAPKN